MGSVRSRPQKGGGRKWYAAYVDIDGTRRTRLLDGVATKEQARKALANIEANVTKGRIGMEEQAPAGKVGALLDTYEAQLKIRGARVYKVRIKGHIRPAFGGMTILAAENAATVVRWIDKLRAGGMAETTLRSTLTVLSGFWQWAIERGHARINPVRLVPRGERPIRQTRQVATPWIQDDAIVVKAMALLDVPVRYAFYLGNRSGMRPGEIAGLRMSDLDWVAEGVIRVRFSYWGPLKEDKDGTGRMKWVPAPIDILDVMGPYIEERRRAGARDDDVLLYYLPKDGRTRKNPAWVGLTEDSMTSRWEKIRGPLGLGKMRWYHATRHSFVSRSLANGASMDEVSAAVGHSSVLVTRAAYDHFERKSWGAAVRAPLKVRPPEAKATGADPHVGDRAAPGGPLDGTDGDSE